MLKTKRYLINQWRKGTINLSKVTRRLGYTGERKREGLRHVREILNEMGIHLA